MPDQEVTATSTPAGAVVQTKTKAAKPGHSSTEFYFGAATAAGCMTIAAVEAAPVCVRATALVVAGAVAISYGFLRARSKGH